ncbi:helix-turn-helix domain-containing protein [Ignavibacteriales bacterium]
MSIENLSDFVKAKRKYLGYTQVQLAMRAGVGLRFLRELEQGKKSLQMDKVNKVLYLFGHELRPAKIIRGESDD